MKKRLLSVLLVLVVAVTVLPAITYAIDGPDYQTALLAQLEAGVKPSATNLFLGLSQWKNMADGPERAMLARRYAAITRLDLSDMGFTQKPAERGSAASDDLRLLEPFTGLEVLDLSTQADTPDASKNTLTNLDYLANFPNLRWLDVSGNQLEAKKGMTGGISGLAGCTRLEVLNLSGNKKLGSTGSVKDAMAVLEQLPWVSELNLSDTAFSDSDVQFVDAMPFLETLDISNTPVKNLDLSDMVWLTNLLAENLTLESLYLPEGLREVDLIGTTLKVTDKNVDDAVTALFRYGDFGLQLTDDSQKRNVVHTVTVADSANGIAEASVRTAAQGTKVSISATPEMGWAQDSIAVSYENADGERMPVTVTGGEFTMPDGNVTVTVTFMPEDILIEYNEYDEGSVSLDRESPARGERVYFVTDLNKGFKVREITARIGSRSVPVYRDEKGEYCFDMPRLRAGETLTFSVTIVEDVAPKYIRSGSFGGQLTFEGLVRGQQYVCQMAEAGINDKSITHTIVTFTAQSTTEKLDVLNSAGGYIVSLWKYDDWATSAQDLTNIFYEVSVK